MEHIEDRHLPSGANGDNASQFLPDTDVESLIREAEGTEPEAQANGREARVVTSPDVVGYDVTAGEYTHTYTATTEANGDLVTAFPGHASGLLFAVGHNMPIRIRLVREGGDQVRSVTDKDGLVDRAAAELGSMRLLRYVDAYRDAYFNRLQMADLLADWQAAEELVETAADEECWGEVEAIIRECQSRTHLYVKFVGD